MLYRSSHAHPEPWAWHPKNPINHQRRRQTKKPRRRLPTGTQARYKKRLAAKKPEADRDLRIICPCQLPFRFLR
jgi:hypothetical protein